MNGDFRVGRWLVQPSLNSISLEGNNVHLEPKVMEVLVCLAQHVGETLPKEKLIETVWADRFVTDDVLKRCISQLRHALEDNAREPRVIQTIHKRGYRLIGPTSDSPASVASGERNLSSAADAFHPRLGVAATGAPWEAVPTRRAQERIHLLMIGAMCALSLSAMYMILGARTSWHLPERLVMGAGNWIVLAGLLSLALTPVTLIAGTWSVVKDKLDRRVRAAMVWFFVLQLAATVALVIALILGGGRLPR